MDYMSEIRTENKNLLICALSEENGEAVITVKSRGKTDVMTVARFMEILNECTSNMHGESKDNKQ